MKSIVISIAVTLFLALTILIALYHSGNGTRQNNEVLFYDKGRDAAVLDLLATAKKTVLVRTNGFDMCEVATALARLANDGVVVTLEVPSDTASKPNDGALLMAVADCGIFVRVILDSAEGYRGTLVVVDDETTLYSASSLTYAVKFSQRPYVLGKVKHGHTA